MLPTFSDTALPSTAPGETAVGDPTRRLVYRVWQAENALSRALEEALRPLDISIAQCGILFHLDLLGPLSAADLSRLIHVTPQGIASTVRRLVELDWVDRRPHAAHGRIVVLTLTAAGRSALVAALCVIDEVEAIVAEGLADADRAALGRILDHLQGRAQAHRAAAD